jgi:hypothetical protein
LFKVQTHSYQKEGKYTVFEIKTEREEGMKGGRQGEREWEGRGGRNTESQYLLETQGSELGA